MGALAAWGFAITVSVTTGGVSRGSWVAVVWAFLLTLAYLFVALWLQRTLESDAREAWRQRVRQQERATRLF